LKKPAGAVPSCHRFFAAYHLLPYLEYRAPVKPEQQKTNGTRHLASVQLCMALSDPQNSPQNDQGSHVFRYPGHRNSRRDPSHCLNLLSTQPRTYIGARVWLLYLLYDSYNGMANMPDNLQGCIRHPPLRVKQRRTHVI
jgi:hypothetical protein